MREFEPFTLNIEVKTRKELEFLHAIFNEQGHTIAKWLVDVGCKDDIDANFDTYPIWKQLDDKL